MAESSSEQNNSEQAKIWSGINIFLKNVTFSDDQIFSINNLSYSNYAEGSILFANGNRWEVLKPDKNNQVLTFNARGLSWQTQNFSYVEGILPVSKGGTGWSLFPDKGILINSGKEVLDLLPFPKEKKLLLGENLDLSWYALDDLTSEIVKKFKTIKIISNEAIFEEFNPILKLKEQENIAGLVLSEKNKKFTLGFNNKELNCYNDLNNSSLAFDYGNNKISFEINNKVVFELNEQCQLQNVFLNSSQIEGKISVQQGGFGDLSFQRGDIFFANSSKELEILSTHNCEGYFLQIRNGIPIYAPLDKSGFDGRFEVPIILPAAKNDFAPLRFNRSALIQNSIEGSLEYDGEFLFLTTLEGRKALSFITSSITGTASNITGIVSLKNGGTGKDLSELQTGQLLIKNVDGIHSFDQGFHGQVLMSQGARSMPAWKDVIVDLETEEGSGVIFDRSNGIIKSRLDQSINFNPVWQGLHTFLQPITIKSKLQLSDDKKAPINFGINKIVANVSIGDMWFDGENLQFFNGSNTINVTKPEVAQIASNDFVQSHYLTLAAGADVSENRSIRMKTSIPHLTTKGSLAQCSWKIRKLDILLDETPNEENAVFSLKCGNKTIIDQAIITIGKEHESFDNFNEIIVSTGEIIRLECIKSGGGNFCSAFLLIDLL